MIYMLNGQYMINNDTNVCLYILEELGYLDGVIIAPNTLRSEYKREFRLFPLMTEVPKGTTDIICENCYDLLADYLDKEDTKINMLITTDHLIPCRSEDRTTAQDRIFDNVDKIVKCRIIKRDLMEARGIRHKAFFDSMWGKNFDFLTASTFNAPNNGKIGSLVLMDEMIRYLSRQRDNVKYTSMRIALNLPRKIDFQNKEIVKIKTWDVDYGENFNR